MTQHRPISVPQPLPANKLRSRLIRSVVALCGLAMLFGLLGYFWLPGYAKAQLEQRLGAEFRRPVSIERVTVAPYALSATVEGLKVGDVLAIGRLQVNFSSASLLRRMPIIAELRIDQPRLHLVRVSENRLNVSDLLDQWAARPDTGPTPPFSVSNIRLNDGQIAWVDQVVNETQTISQIQLGIPFIANTPSQDAVYVEPAFSAHLNGADLSLTGKARPFAQGQDAALEISLEDFDLTRVSGYVKLPVTLQSARLSTRLQVQFLRRAGGAASLTVAGDLALKQLKAALPARKLAIDLPQLSFTGIQADVFGQKLAVAQVAMQAQPNATPTLLRAGAGFAGWQELKLSALQLDMNARQVQLGEAGLEAPTLQLARTATGSLDLMEAFAGETVAGARGAARQAAPAWRWTLGRLALNSGKLRFVDRAGGEPHALEMSSIQFEAKALAGTGDQLSPFTLQASVNEHGRLNIQGEVAPTGRADMKVTARQVDLVALQGWATDTLNAVLTRGEADFSGEVHVTDGRVSCVGDVGLHNFNVLDRVNAEDMLRWKLLRLDKVVLHSQPFSLDIGDMALRDFFAQLLVNAQGQLNLKGIVRTADAKPAPAATPSVAADGPALPIRIGKISLSGGAIEFSDEFIRPNYTARLSALNGRIGALAAGKQSAVEISGKVDRTAPVHIVGWVDPLSSPISLNLQASARGVEMPNLSSYSGRYLGYAIDKGKLSMDVSYQINKGELNAQNKLFLDQLTLGDKVESPDALDIPVSLAIALLKNSRGEIDLDLPIHGSLNDPEFHIGGIVFKVLVNVVVKAVTSPFALLGALFGTGEDLSSVVFVGGSSQLTPEIVGKLQSLGKAMADRPALKMEVTGYADPLADREGLKREFLLRKLKARKLEESARRGKTSTSLDEVSISAGEYPEWLEKVYRDEDIPNKPRNALRMQKSLPVAEMEALLLAHIAVTEADLTELAEARGNAVQDWLTGSGGVAMERVFLLSGQLNAADKAVPGSRVSFSLR